MAIIVAAAGGGNWTAGGTWTGGVAPTAADDVQLASTSGNITINAASVCRSLDCTGYTGTLTHTAAFILSIGDATAGASNIALKFVAGMTYTLGNVITSAISFISTSATQQTIDFAGKTTGDIVYGVSGSPSYQMTGTHVQGATATVTLTFGTLDVNGQTSTWGKFASSNSNTRVLTLGAAAISLNLTSGTSWNMTTTTGLTVNANTSVITVAGPTIFTGGGKTYNEVKFTSAGIASVSSTNTFAILRVTNTSGLAGLQLFNNQTVSTTLEFTGNNANSNRVLLGSDTPGSQRTITANGTLSLTNVDFLDIIGAGTGSWTGTSIGNCGNNSGITFTSAVTRYWVGNNGNYHATTNWSTSSGGSSGASMPLPQDTAIIDASSITTTTRVIDVQHQQRIGPIDFTGVLNTPAFGHGTYSLNFYGSITFVSAMTISSHHNYNGRGSHTITSNGLSIGTILLTVDAGTGTITFADAYVHNASLSYKSGTLTAQSNMTITGVFFNGSTTRTINLGSGTWTLTGTSPWSGSSFGGVTINSNTSTIKLTDNSASTKGFGFSSGGPYTYNKLWIATAGAGKIQIFRANTFTTFKAEPGTIIEFPTTFTQTIGTWDAKGTSGNLITFTTSSAGTAVSLSVASGIVDGDYLSLKDSTATGGATFYAGSHSTNVSGNTGWSFTDAPVTTNFKDKFMVFFD